MSTIEGQREKVILEILYGSGIRVSELVNIKLKDIDFSGKTILIFGKENKERIVPFGDYALEALNIYLDDAREKYLDGRDSEYLIVGKNEAQLTTRRIEQILQHIYLIMDVI